MDKDEKSAAAKVFKYYKVSHLEDSTSKLGGTSNRTTYGMIPSLVPRLERAEGCVTVSSIMIPHTEAHCH